MTSTDAGYTGPERRSENAEIRAAVERLSAQVGTLSTALVTVSRVQARQVSLEERQVELGTKVDQADVRAVVAKALAEDVKRKATRRFVGVVALVLALAAGGFIGFGAYSTARRQASRDLCGQRNAGNQAERDFLDAQVAKLDQSDPVQAQQAGFLTDLKTGFTIADCNRLR